MILRIALVMLGGALGALARFLLTMAVGQGMPSLFPLGTLVVNVLGSLLIGVLAVVLVHSPDSRWWLRELLMVGVLGGFTTFSSFSLDSVSLLIGQQQALAWMNVGLSVVLCLLACYVGTRIGHYLL